MPSVRLPIPNHQSVRELVYVDSYPSDTGLVYIHRVRQCGPDHPLVIGIADYYWRGIAPIAARRLALMLKGRKFDAIVSPPSRRDDIAPYKAAIVAIFPDIVDLSDGFARRAEASAGTTPSCDVLYEALTFIPGGDLKAVESVLMVDDSFASGTTACAVLRHLRVAGLPDDASFTVAAPLWIKAAAKSPS